MSARFHAFRGRRRPDQVLSHFRGSCAARSYFSEVLERFEEMQAAHGVERTQRRLDRLVRYWVGPDGGD
jgi:hypothetical protein